MKKRRLGRVVVATFLTCSLVVTPVFAEPTIDELKEKKEQAQDEVESLQSELTTLISKIDQLELDLIEKGEEVEEATAKLAEAEEQEQQQYEDMKMRIKYMYENGDSDLEKIFDSQSISDVLTKAEYIQSVHTYDRDMLDKYVETKNEVAALKAQLEQEMQNMEEMQAEFEKEKENLNDTIEEKQAEVADFDQQLQAAIEEATRKAEEEARKKAEEEARRRAQQAASSNSGSSSSGSSSSGGSSQNIKPPSGVSGEAVVEYAKQFIGNKYVWGGTSLTNGTDCSGFTQGVYKAFGYSLPRTSAAQRSAGRGVSYSEAQPGDLICYDGHVAIYIGNGAIIHASNSKPYPAGGIKISNNAQYRKILAVRRIIN